MLTEHARVIAVDDDGLWVETYQKSLCGACSAKSGCGQHLLAKFMPDLSCIKARFLEGKTQQIWKLGDKVNIGVEENALVANALLIYLLPLLCLLLMVSLAHHLALSEIVTAIMGFVGLGLGSLAIKYFYPYLLKKKLRALDVIVLDK